MKISQVITLRVTSPQLVSLRSIRMAAFWVSLVAGLGCKDLTGNQQLPSGTADPASYNTPAGALGQRIAAISAFITAVPQVVLYGGALSDEFVTMPCKLDNCPVSDPDQRLLLEGNTNIAVAHPTDNAYTALHRVRGLAGQAIGQLATYAPESAPSMRGELYAIAGYAELFLADLFCAGVPLSTLDFHNDYTYQPSSTTEQVYQHAIVLFDSALALAGDSARILNLARVGKGRALVNLGDYAQAAQAVAAVPDLYRYQLPAQWRDSAKATYSRAPITSLREADQEGGIGMPFLLKGDPRSAAQSVSGGSGARSLPVKMAARVNSAGYGPLTIADGTEARLIQAEAALRAGDPTTWLSGLNYLRATALVPGAEQANPQQLPALAMPSSDSARIALMFQERAEWLFVTGHRQGDLRRQLRQDMQYWPTPATLYPVGVFPTGGLYGNDVTAPIPASELTNPLYHGCLNRDA
jgi:tetratricopeptide (TPR) repeat protein